MASNVMALKALHAVAMAHLFRTFHGADKAVAKAPKRPPVPSPALAELIKNYPHTLVNGQGLAVGTNQRLQPSMVVEIPR